MPKDDSLATAVDDADSKMAVDDLVPDTAQGKSNMLNSYSGGTLAMEQETGKHSNFTTGVVSLPKGEASHLLGTGTDVSEFLLSVMALSG